jgi:hypothetical protein
MCIGELRFARRNDKPSRRRAPQSFGRGGWPQRQLEVKNAGCRVLNAHDMPAHPHQCACLCTTGGNLASTTPKSIQSCIVNFTVCDWKRCSGCECRSERPLSISMSLLFLCLLCRIHYACRLLLLVERRVDGYPGSVAPMVKTDVAGIC